MRPLTHLPSALACLALAALAGCASRQDDATQLLTEAREACQAANYGRAKMLCDSLRAAYVDVPDVYKQARELAQTVSEAERARTCQFLDSTIAALEQRRDSIMQGMTLVDDKAPQPTYVARTQQFFRSFDRCLLRGTVDPAGGFSLTSNYTGEQHINHHHVRVKAGDALAEAAVVFDLAFNHQFESDDRVWEVVRYGPDDSDNLAKFVTAYANEHILVEFIGDKSRSRAWLTPTDKDAMRLEWALALTLRELTKAQSVKRETLGVKTKSRSKNQARDRVDANPNTNPNTPAL